MYEMTSSCENVILANLSQPKMYLSSNTNNYCKVSNVFFFNKGLLNIMPS